MVSPHLISSVLPQVTQRPCQVVHDEENLFIFREIGKIEGSTEVVGAVVEVHFIQASASAILKIPSRIQMLAVLCPVHKIVMHCISCALLMDPRLYREVNTRAA
jgi:hypothetical protein